MCRSTVQGSRRDHDRTTIHKFLSGYGMPLEWKRAFVHAPGDVDIDCGKNMAISGIKIYRSRGDYRNLRFKMI